MCVCLGEGTRSFLIPSFKVERVNDYGGADLVLTPCQTHPPLDGTKHAHPPSPAPLVSSRDGHISSDGFLKFGCLLFTCNLKVEFIYTHAISNWLSKVNIFDIMNQEHGMFMWVVSDLWTHLDVWVQSLSSINQFSSQNQNWMICLWTDWLSSCRS